MAEQHDDHIWLTCNGEAWAIRVMRWPIIYLWRGYWPNLEYSAVDMTNFDAESYTIKALELLGLGRNDGPGAQP